MNLTGSMFLSKGDLERERFIQWLGSLPMHEDDRGPDNRVLIDYLPAGDDFGETGLRRLADAIIKQTSKLAMERFERAIRACPGIDENGYICEKSVIFTAVRDQMVKP
jgi:hypothetical protein